MITFELACDKGHRFEGWFANREAFDRQLADNLIRCPLCDSTAIEKKLSAVAVHVGRSEPSAAPAPSEGPKKAPPVSSFMRALGEFVEKNFEDVGGNFAAEARKIHEGEAENRSIRGVTTSAEEEALKEEGIDFFKLALPKYDA